MRRAVFGERVESTRWNYGSMQRARHELLDGGWMEERSTPKGKKRYLVLTAKGRALMPEVERYYAEAKRDSDRAIAASNLEERRRAAAPELIEVMRALSASFAEGVRVGLLR